LGPSCIIDFKKSEKTATVRLQRRLRLPVPSIVPYALIKP
jgi:hypothetical protein